MTISSKKKIILTITALVILVGVTVFLANRKKETQLKNGEPQQSVEEILNERTRQSMTHLDTPIGKAFAMKNWVEFLKIYDPQKNFHDLGEIIRAGFIGGQFKTFTKEDMDKVLNITLNTFSTMKTSDMALAGLLVTQFERLPSPERHSENYKILESWFMDPNVIPAKKKMSVLKLGIQDANPEAKWVNVIAEGITGKTYGVSRQQWIQMIGDMRNLPARKTVLKTMLKEFSHIDSEVQPEALIELAQEPGLTPKPVKEICMRFFASKDQREFEASLKAITPLFKEHAFSVGEIQKIKDKLVMIPEKINTPFVEVKSKELLNILSTVH